LQQHLKVSFWAIKHSTVRTYLLGSASVKKKKNLLSMSYMFRRISVPDVLPDTKLTILASTPHFFTRVMRKLKLSAHQ
jgi:hypothetical protein